MTTTMWTTRAQLEYLPPSSTTTSSTCSFSAVQCIDNQYHAFDPILDAVNTALNIEVLT